MKDDAVNPVIKDFIRSQQDVIIDRYSDKGGFGELYFGKRTILGDRVALKFYDLENSGSDHIEPQLLRTINHENILPIYDARIIDNSIAYYLTPEISGGDLQNIIDNYILKTDIAVNIVQGVLKGLNELHKDPRNLVHRDIKTLNILIDKNSGKPYLADFGTVKQIPPDGDFVTSSKFSFLYRPFETVAYNQYYKQSDLYQVGVILYQSLGGFFPIKDPIKWLEPSDRLKFQSLDEFDKQIYLRNYIEKLILSGKIIRLTSLPIFINKKMVRIIKAATNLNLEKRFKNCSEFLKALYEYQKDAKSWWIENGLFHSLHQKKGIYFRIIKDANGFIIEMKTPKVNWRKKITFKTVKECVEYIEAF